MEMERAMKFAVVIEPAEGNWSAYVPDLDGCVATGKSPQDAERQIREAITLHLQGMKEDGLPLPEPCSTAVTVEVAA